MNILYSLIKCGGPPKYSLIFCVLIKKPPLGLFQTEIGLWFAFAASGTAVADRLHAAGLALLAEVWLVASFVGDRHTEQIAELEVDRLALIAQT